MSPSGHPGGDRDEPCDVERLRRGINQEGDIMKALRRPQGRGSGDAGRSCRQLGEIMKPTPETQLLMDTVKLLTDEIDRIKAELASIN